jgi:hypothetical protein
LGLMARYWYLKHDEPRQFSPPDVEKSE